MMRLGWARIAALGMIALLLPACGTGGGGGTLTPTVAPGIPTNVVARAGNRSATIDWAASVVGAQYTVLRSLLPDGPFFPISVPAQFRAATTYVDSGLTNGTTYYYEVVATNRFGASPPSAVVSATPGFKATAADGGGSDLLALLPDGSVWEWGEPHGGGLSDAPVQVPGLTDITAVSVHLNHNLALGSDGTVWAWGLQSSGQLGPEGVGVVTVPVPVTGITDAIAISAGEQHSLALRHDGRVLAWGSNQQGQFGLGITTPAQSSTPQEVPGLTNIIAIEAGTYQSLALRNDGLVFSWGQNPNGELGNPPVSSNTFPPLLITNLTGVVKISAGTYHCLALRNDGTVYAWGNNSQAQLGQGSTGAALPAPTRINSLTGIVDIVAGGTFSLAVRNDGKVWSWGYNADGQLGQGTSGAPIGTPAQVLSINNGALVAGSNYNGVALATDGTVWTWGDNTKGGLGNGSGQVGQIPVEVPNFTGAISVAGGDNFSIAVRSNGTVWGWGTNTAGQLGTGGTSPNPVTAPVQASGITTATAVTAGFNHGLALLTGGTVVGWGNNAYGQVGDGSSGNIRPTPVSLPALAKITTIVSTELHNAAIKDDPPIDDRTLYTWGYNVQGQLGQGTTGAPNPTPTKIANFSGIISVATGDRHTIAAKSDGTVWVWGANDMGQLGQGSIGGPNVPDPTPVAGITDAVAVGSGLFHCLVIRSNGTVLAWGSNDFGQLGNGTKTTNPSPGPVPGLEDVTSATGGILFSLARKSDGTIWSWGDNSFGQLGNTVPGFSANPVPVLQLPAVSAARAGSTHAVSLVDNGTIRCWGRNLFSQLGVAYVSLSTTPVTVSR
jgi:alpha-tubulin suppressor-like RCC1 family protein